MEKRLIFIENSSQNDQHIQCRPFRISDAFFVEMEKLILKFM